MRDSSRCDGLFNFNSIIMKRLFKIFSIAALAALSTSCARIDSSEIGIKFQKYGLTDQGVISAVPVSGYVLYNPLTTGIYTLDGKIRNVDYKPFEVQAKGGGKFMADVYFAYRLRRDAGVSYFAKYRRPLSEIERTTLNTYVIECYKTLIGSYTPEEAVNIRIEIEQRATEILKAKFSENGFELDEFVGTIIPPASLTATIDAKNEAVQVALRAENEVALAEAEAKISIAKAKGEADALKIKADAEAYYNRTIANSITPSLIQYQYAERWNGILPTTTGGAIPLLNMK